MRGFPPNEVSRHHKWFQTGVEKPDVSTFALYVWAAATCSLEEKWKVMRPRMSLAVRSFQRAASFICTFTNCSNCEAVQAGEGTIPKKKKRTCLQWCVPACARRCAAPLLCCLHPCCNDFYAELCVWCLDRGSKNAMPQRPTAMLGN